MKPPLSKKQYAKVIFPICLCTIFLISCGKDDIDMFDCTGFEPTYTAEIKPILDGSCALSGCHDATSAEDGIILSTYASASAESKNDRFLGCIQHKRGYTSMPEEAAKLSAEKNELLPCWVQSGSKE